MRCRKVPTQVAPPCAKVVSSVPLKTGFQVPLKARPVPGFFFCVIASTTRKNKPFRLAG